MNLNKIQNYVPRNVIIISLCILTFTLEKFYFDVGVGGRGFKLYHLVFGYFSFRYFTDRLFRDLTLKEIFWILLFTGNLLFSISVSFNPQKSLVWAAHITLILLGCFSARRILSPSVSELWSGIILGSVPLALYTVIEWIYRWVTGDFGVISNGYGAPRLTGWTFEPANLSFFMFFGAAPCLFQLIAGKNLKEDSEYRLHQWQLWGSVLCLFGAIISTGRTGWLCILFYLLICALANPSRRSLKLILSAAATLAIATLISKSARALLFDYFTKPALGADPRIMGQEAAWTLLKEFGITGIGIGGFGSAAIEMLRKYPKYLWELEWLTFDRLSLMKWELTPFNSILEVLLSFGLLGSVWLMGSLIFMIRQLFRPEISPVACLAMAAVIGTAVNQNIFRPHLIFVFFFLMGHKQRTQNAFY